MRSQIIKNRSRKHPFLNPDVKVGVKKRGKKGKVLVALSGGIDSAVSAYLLIKQGYQVEAAFMKNWSSTEGLKYNECPWLTDRKDALRVAAFLNIPLYTLDFEKEYGETVMNYFFEEYSQGRTPNPDVMCNKEIKFKILYQWAMDHGFDFLATGHYAQIASSAERLAPSKNNLTLGARRFSLMRSADEFKDQTYFIYNIRHEQLPHLLFPIGGMKKTQVRAMAKKLKLPNANKAESMGLCFVGKIRLQDFLNQKLKPKPGPIVDQAGKRIGEHQGLHYYTIGQRQGIRVSGTKPYYVFKKNLKTNTLYVTDNPKDKLLETREVTIHSVNWITNDLKLKIKDLRLTGRFRHQGDLVPLTVRQTDSDHYQIKFKQPQKAIASGQSLVLYSGKICLGGGVIV